MEKTVRVRKGGEVITISPDQFHANKTDEAPYYFEGFGGIHFAGWHQCDLSNGWVADVRNVDPT